MIFLSALLSQKNNQKEEKNKTDVISFMENRIELQSLDKFKPLLGSCTLGICPLCKKNSFFFKNSVFSYQDALKEIPERSWVLKFFFDISVLIKNHDLKNEILFESEKHRFNYFAYSILEN